jgi:hypothetical protein
MALRKRLAGLALAFAFVCTAWGAQPAPVADTMDLSAGNLLVVLRESVGENKQDEVLQPYGRITAAMPDGKRIELAPSWYRYLGDMHIRLVFDGGQTLQSALPNDLERLRLSPEDALDLAVRNLKRMYGRPEAVPWSGGLQQVQSGSPDFASSYFLDRDFWLGQLREHPEGIVAAVPQRGGLVFGAAGDEDAVEELRFSVAALYAAGGGARVSSALYLFKDGRWSIFQRAQKLQ